LAGFEQEATRNLSLSSREERAGREPERGAFLINAPPLPSPLLPQREEREKSQCAETLKRN
jgi:hypothetical protein